ncbi:MAG TPA: preprotein translocase subunit YajC [Gaiellaceae bacterium]|nr:preprotein translocase subunit YajC [Gaiellaceae bacterium]
MGYLIIIVVLFAVMWLFLVRPQRRRQVEQAQMQETLEPGAEVLTAGGIHGTVRELHDDVVHVEIAPGTVVRVDRRAIAGVAQEPEHESETEDGPAPTPHPEQAAPDDAS